MKPGSGNPSKLPDSPWFSQRRWRRVGIGCLIAAVMMSWYGAEHPWPGVWWGLGYWGVVGVLVLMSVYSAFLDMQFIRLQYRLGEREIFMDTLGSESFRQELRQMAEEEATKPVAHPGMTDEHDL